MTREIVLHVQINDVTTFEEATEIASLLKGELGINVTPNIPVGPTAVWNDDINQFTYHHPQIRTFYGPCITFAVSWNMAKMIIRRAERVGWNVMFRGVWMNKDRTMFFECLFRDCHPHELSPVIYP